MSTTGESDKFVTLIASLKGRKPVRRLVRKDVIQSESSFLKEYIEDGATEIKIPLKRPKNLNVILEYLYEGQLTVSTGNHLKSLWNDARILGLVNLQKVCIQRLRDTITLDSWIQRLEFSQADGCHELESNVLSFVNANFEDCSTSTLSFTSLSVDQMVQVLQLPTVTESDRIALILDWIKANEVDRCRQAHRLLEQIDLMKLTENSIRSIFDEESAFRSWRSVAIFERAIRLKRVEQATRHSDTVPAHSNDSEPVEAGPALFESLNNRQIINIKQEVALEESSSDAEVNESFETMNREDSVRDCGIGVKQEVSPPLASSVCETLETNEDGPPAPKMPRLEYSQNETESVVPSQLNQIDFVSKRKQILYFSQSSDGARSLNSIIFSADSISRPQQVLATLPECIHGVPKLIWVQEARKLRFLGDFAKLGRRFPVLNNMNDKWRPRVIFLPQMLHPRQHHYQPVLLNGCLYVFGGSKSIDFKNNDRFSGAEVLDLKASRRKLQWQPITPTRNQRDLYAATCVEGNIYITGGAIDRPKKNQPLITKSVVCYLPAENRMKQLSSMKRSRCGHALAVLGHKIYVFGGRGYINNIASKDLVNLQSAEVYDVHSNKWECIETMGRPRYGGSAVEIEGKIYVIGGDQFNDGKSGSSVECYDPVSNSWNFVCESVDDQGLFDSITVIDDPEYFLKGTLRPTFEIKV